MVAANLQSLQPHVQSGLFTATLPDAPGPGSHVLQQRVVRFRLRVVSRPCRSTSTRARPDTRLSRVSEVRERALPLRARRAAGGLLESLHALVAEIEMPICRYGGPQAPYAAIAAWRNCAECSDSSGAHSRSIGSGHTVSSATPTSPAVLRSPACGTAPARATPRERHAESDNGSREIRHVAKPTAPLEKVQYSEPSLDLS
jgi:hypothetical protein